MLDYVREYYGQILQSTDDLKTSACCTPTAAPEYIQTALKAIHPEVESRYYGCGLLVPEALAGARILDLGSGSGRDCFLLSQLVGADGLVVGVDMTEEQLAVARQHQAYHSAKFGFDNVEFYSGYIEALDALPLERGSFDIVVSNCVINLSPAKGEVFRGAYELLKPGGEMYFADVYADRRVPSAVATDPVLYGECLGGAMYVNDFLQEAVSIGFRDPRLVTSRPLELHDPEIRKTVGDVTFHSATFRLFREDSLEPHREDYGQTATYLGTVAHSEEALEFDGSMTFLKGQPQRVCGNTFAMLEGSRFAKHFKLEGDRSHHLGAFQGADGVWVGSTIAEQFAAGAETGACC